MDSRLWADVDLADQAPRAHSADKSARGSHLADARRPAKMPRLACQSPRSPRPGLARRPPGSQAGTGGRQGLAADLAVDVPGDLGVKLEEVADAENVSARAGVCDD